MGVEIAFYVIPRANDFRPAPEAIARLVREWLAAGFIARPGSAAHDRLDFSWSEMDRAGKQTGAFAQTGRRELRSFPVPPTELDVAALGQKSFRLAWPIVTSWAAGLKYALTRAPDLPLGNPGPFYHLELHSSDDYVYLKSEVVEPFANDDPQDWSVRCKTSNTDLTFDAPTDEDFFGLLPSRIRHTCPKCRTIFRPQDRLAGLLDGWTGERHEQPGGGTYRFAILVDCGNSVPEEPATVVPEFLAIAERVFGQEFYVVANFY